MSQTGFVNVLKRTKPERSVDLHCCINYRARDFVYFHCVLCVLRVLNFVVLIRRDVPSLGFAA